MNTISSSDIWKVDKYHALGIVGKILCTNECVGQCVCSSNGSNLRWWTNLHACRVKSHDAITQFPLYTLQLYIMLSGSSVYWSLDVHTCTQNPNKPFTFRLSQLCDQGEPASTPLLYLLEWGLLVAIFNPGNVKFGLNNPGFSLCMGYLPWLDATSKKCWNWTQRSWFNIGLYIYHG
jgi:hypothetical protein